MSKPNELARIHEISSLIGNTPLLEIEFTQNGRTRTIYAKAEHMNMTGSTKDRMAHHILARGVDSGALREGATIAEATSGNTGIAFAAIGRALGHPVVIFMPDWMSEERIKLIRSLGAEVRLVSSSAGGFLGAIQLAEELASSREDVFLPRQFSNQDNSEAHYRTTGPEIWWQLQARGIEPDAFVAGVGTGGTIMGVGGFLREKKPSTKVCPLEPSNSPTLSTGHKAGHHRIQGISDEFVPAIVDLDALDRIVSVDDGDAILMAQKLAAELGLAVGISSGANFLGAVEMLDELGDDAVVVTVFADDNKKYLSTGLLQKEPVREGSPVPEISLTRLRAYSRVCHTCCSSDACQDYAASAGATVHVPFCPRGMHTRP